jgi:hypothetical protein
VDAGGAFDGLGARGHKGEDMANDKLFQVWMAQMQSRRESFWEGLCRLTGLWGCLLMPGFTLFELWGKDPDMPRWPLYGLIGLSAFLLLIAQLLRKIARDLSWLTNLVAWVLQEPDDDEPAISLHTYRVVRQYARQQIGLRPNDGEGA